MLFVAGFLYGGKKQTKLEVIPVGRERGSDISGGARSLVGCPESLARVAV